MNVEIDLFCFAITDKGLLTTEQCTVLQEICSDNAAVSDFVDLILSTGLMDDRKTLEQIQEQVCGALSSEQAQQTESAATTDAAGVIEESAFEMPPIDVSPELDWFCFYGVTEGILTAETCVATVANIAGTTELLPFTQVMIDGGVCDDFVTVQQLADRARDQARMEPTPPFSVFQFQAA